MRDVIEIRLSALKSKDKCVNKTKLDSKMSQHIYDDKRSPEMACDHD